MPIIDVEIVTPGNESLPEALATQLAEAFGEAFRAAPGKVWVRLRNLPAAGYAENGGPAPHPVFVTVIAGDRPEGAPLLRLVERLTEAVARLAKRPRENVHVLFEPGARGRIAFGGELVE